MLTMFDRPRLGQLAVLGVLSGLSGGLAIGLWVREEAVWASMALLISFGLGLALLAGLWNFWAVVETARYETRRRAELESAFSLALSRAAALTPEQAAVVPRMMYEVETMVVQGARREIGFVLATAGGPVPYEWIAGFLADSSVLHLRAIGSFADKTAGRLYAQAFTQWLVDRKYAVPSNGNKAALWSDEQQREKVMRDLRLYELLSFSHMEVGE